MRDPADNQPEQHERHRPGRKRQKRFEEPCVFCRTGGQRRHHSHRQHNRKVLNDQKSERNAPMQRIKLALVRKQLDDDDRAGECQRHRHIEAGNRGHAKPQTNEKSDNRGENDLAGSGIQRHDTKRSHQIEIELQPYEEK